MPLRSARLGSQLGATGPVVEALDLPDGVEQPYRTLEAAPSDGASADVRLSPSLGTSPFRLPQIQSLTAGLEMGGASSLERWAQQPADPHEVAVVWVRKAKKGSVQWVDECSKSQFMYYRLFKKMKPLTRVIKMVFLCLAFFETPSWCLKDTMDCAGDRPGMMAFMLPVMPTAVGNYLEIACLLWFLARMHVRKKALGTAYACVRWRLFGLVTLLVALLDCCVSVFNLVGVVPGTFRLARLCRPFVLLSFTKPLREVAIHVVLCIPKVGDVLLSLALAFVGSVVAGLVLFANTAEGEQKFRSWDEAFASLWVLFTTANFPDVMVPAINDRRSYFLFFLAYLVLTLFLLSNILLAAVYNAYKIQLKASVRVKQTNRFHSLRKAFQQMANDQGELSKNDWMRFFALYTRGVTAAGQAEACAESPESEARLAIDQRSLAILDLLDVSGSLRGMQFHEFKRGMDALLSKYVYFPRSVAPWLTHPHRFHCLRSFIEGKLHVCGLVLTWDVALDLVIFADLVGMVVRIISFVSLDFKEQLEHRDLTFYLWFCVSLLYIADSWLKIVVFGRERFWYRSPTFYRFDFVCSHFVLLVEAFFLFNSRPIYGRSVVLVRLMRTCRLLRYITALRNLYSLLTRLLPTYLQLAALLFLVFYIFATVGVQVFGGLIFESNKSLVGSDFANGDYWALNFNDFPSGLMTLFVVMVVNNWYIIADGFNRAAGTKFACLFFVVFFIVTNLIVLNIFVAFILECFLNLNDEHGFSRHTDNLLDQDEGPGTATGGSFVQHSVSHSDEPVHSISFRRSSIPLLRARINANEMLRRVLLAEDEEFVDTTNWLARLETNSNVGRHSSHDASPGGSTIINGISPRHPYQASRPRRESAPPAAWNR